MTSIGSSIAGTIKLYYQNSDKARATARILDFNKDDIGSYFIFNQTIFHPQGGGQPSDVGQLSLEGKKLNVVKLTEDKDSGIIRHYIDSQQSNELKGTDLIGKSITQTIDLEKRILYAQQHTGGHLLANIVESLAPNLIGYNGYHFPDGPYVKFKVTAEKEGSTESKEDKVELKEEPKKTKEGKKKADAKSSILFTKDEIMALAKQYIGAGLPIYVNNNEIPRTVQIAGLKAYPCGGTHLTNLADLGSLQIREIKKDKSDIKIKYAVGEGQKSKEESKTESK